MGCRCEARAKWDRIQVEPKPSETPDYPPAAVATSLALPCRLLIPGSVVSEAFCALD